MKNILSVVLLCLISLPLAAGQQASTTNGVEDQIKKLLAAIGSPVLG